MMDDDQEKTPKRKAEALSPVAAPPAPEKRTPVEWAEKLGHVKKASPFTPQLRTHFSWQHAAADSLHGWSQHAHHYQIDPLMLCESDYVAALEAAAEYPNKPAHAAALSKTKEIR